MEMLAMVFVQEVGYLLCEVAQLHVPPEAHHVSVEGLLSLECTPANAVSAATAKIVGNLAPPSCPSPNVCPDPAGHTPSRCISFQRLRLNNLNPEPVSIPGIRYPLVRLYRLIRPVVICKFLVVVVDSSCLKEQSSRD
jgi:hypothetical protein